MTKVGLIELNEVNFDALRYYVANGALPTFGKLIHQYGYVETTSESQYDELEPWIQWVTAHTGLSLKEHGVFRLGDIVNHDIPQIWETLEAQGYCVGAISPMNAKNRLQCAPFFMPDPWTKTHTSGPKLLSKLHMAIGQIVGDNAHGAVTKKSFFWLLVGLICYARPRNYKYYFRMVMQRNNKPWSKPMFLDLFLTDIFIQLNKSHLVDFASLFLNAGAHIQHHYLFNSPAYQNIAKNPSWYVSENADPLLEIYTLYDMILKQIMDAMPLMKLLVATGLHQDPHPTVAYYWRLKNHASFLDKIGISYASIEPLMSRDFIVRFNTKNEANVANSVLDKITDDKGTCLFEVDNRGEDLFIMLTYPYNITQEIKYYIDGKSYSGLHEDVAFVAIKNGQHNGIGYLINTQDGHTKNKITQMELKQIPQIVTNMLIKSNV
jgi:hypothetical protein